MRMLARPLVSVNIGLGPVINELSLSFLRPIQRSIYSIVVWHTLIVLAQHMYTTALYTLIGKTKSDPLQVFVVEILQQVSSPERIITLSLKDDYKIIGG